MIRFFIAMKVPTKTYQSGKRVTCRQGKPIFYEDEALKALRAKLTAKLALYAPKTEIDGAIQLNVKWCFELTKGKYHGQPKDTKPDVDNMQKLIKDCMTDTGFWHDDAQVVCEIAEKYYSEVPGVYISVDKIPSLNMI